MNRSQLSSLLESITGQIQPQSPEQEKQLFVAQQRIASSLLQKDSPDTGADQLFGDSDFYSRDKIKSSDLKRIDEIAVQALRSVESGENERITTRAFIRTVPVRTAQVAGSIPEWAAGAKPVEIFGPFINNDGREIWIDIYRIEKLIVLYAGTTPVLLFKALLRQGPLVINPAQAISKHYNLLAGSLWVNIKLLDPAAPADKFVGVKINGGTVDLSLLPVLQNNNITLAPSTAIEVSVEMMPKEDEPGAGGSYAQDARDAKYKLPLSWKFGWNNKLTIHELASAACEIYGQGMDLNFIPANNSAVKYNGELNLVTVPLQASIQEFSVLSCKSPFWTISGIAPLLNSYWSLPATTLDVNNPVEAEGNGGVLLECDKGLRASWMSLLNEDLRLTKPFISGSPGSLSVIDLQSDSLGASSYFELWKDNLNPKPSSADLLFLESTPFFYAANSENSQELLLTLCDATINADRPVKVNDEAFEIRSKNTSIMLAGSETRRLIYLLDDNLLWDNKKTEEKNPVIKPVAIALENALFTVSPVAGFLLFGECDEKWKKIQRANFFTTFGLYSYLPTLPDPYIARLSAWRRIFERDNTRVDNATGAALKGPLLLLVCAVRYTKRQEENDNVTTGFHFGAPPLTITGLPDETPIAAPERRQILRSERASLSAAKLTDLGIIKNSVRITAASVLQPTVDKNPFREIIPGAVTTLAPQPVLDINLNEQEMKAAVQQTMRGYHYENFWDNVIGANRVNADAFALLDVSSNANQMGVSVNGNMVIVQTGRVEVDPNNNENQVVRSNAIFPFIVDGMEVKSPAKLVRSFTLPLISWEPVINLSPPDRENIFDPNSPKLPLDPEAGNIYFENDGGPSHIWNNNSKPVALSPIPVIQSLLDDFKSNPANFTIASFTLPFGLKAISYISKNFIEPVKPDIKNITPLFRKKEDGTYRLKGGIQLSLQAGNYGKKMTDPAESDSNMFPGYTIQLNNLLNPLGAPTGASNLGQRVTEIFNNEFLIQPLTISNKLNKSRGVPVSRMDVTGYGSNIFSNWFSPTALLAQTSQARFDVMLGRTGHEVIQVRSILYPWGIRVVRTITLFRTATGYVYRVDSGWKAESDGKFDFSYKFKKKINPNGNENDDPTSPGYNYVEHEEKEPYEFHPGIIKGLFNVRNIKDAPSVAEFTSTNHINGGALFLNGVLGKEEIKQGGPVDEFVKCGGVYFDADVEIENVVQGHINKKVVSKKILGYVQVAPAGKPLTKVQLKDLLALQKNSIGGDLDCVVDINKSDQQMRLNRFDVSASPNDVNDINNPVFVVAARGNVFLPKDGSWAMVQHNVGTGEVIPLPTGVTVPLIRTGKWIKGEVINPAVAAAELVRVAHTSEILRAPNNETNNFGFLQSTSTQKALFLTPAYGANQKMLLSKTPPIYADAYRLMTGKGIFPNIGNAIDNFGKAMPLLNGIDGGGAAAKAFVTNALKDGTTNVLELMKIEAEKAGETVVKQGLSLLQKGVGGAVDKALKFDVPPFDIPLVDTKGLKIYIEYKAGQKKEAKKDSKLNFDVESFAVDAAKQWKSRLNNVSMVVDLGDMKRLMTIKGNFDAAKGKESGYEGGADDGLSGLPVPEIEFSDDLKPVIEILEVLSQLSTGKYAEAMKKGLKIAMSNSGEVWEYKFEAGKEIPIVRFPPTDELYNSAQTPLKLEASLGVGVFFNAALKVTTEPGQLLPTAGAFLKFHGGLSVMCLSVGVGSIYAIGSVDVKIACDTKVGPSLALAFGFGVQIVVSLPIVGNASVTYMIGIELYVDKSKVIIAALMLFRGSAELLGGLVCVTITIEAKGIVVKTGNETECSAQVTFAIDISIFLIIDISFSKTWGESRQIA